MAARINWKSEFSSLLANDRLTGRDREFIADLHRHWSARKPMTSGRKHWFLKIRDKIAAIESTPDSADADRDLLARLDTIIERAEQDSWDRNFAMSLRDQVRTGRALSPKQAYFLADKEPLYSDDAADAAAVWNDTFRVSDRVDRFKLMVDYYRRNGYFQRIVSRADAGGADYVPSEKDYRAITENKYSKKILAGWFDDAAFAVGSMVSGRASAPNGLRNKLAVILEENAKAPTSASKGNKIYKVLPVGSPTPILVEERALKHARRPKKR